MIVFVGGGVCVDTFQLIILIKIRSRSVSLGILFLVWNFVGT